MQRRLRNGPPESDWWPERAFGRCVTSFPSRSSNERSPSCTCTVSIERADDSRLPLLFLGCRAGAHCNFSAQTTDYRILTETLQRRIKKAEETGEEERSGFCDGRDVFDRLQQRQQEQKEEDWRGGGSRE